MPLFHSENCKLVAAAVVYRLKKDRLLSAAELWVILEHDVFFDWRRRQARFEAPAQKSVEALEQLERYD